MTRWTSWENQKAPSLTWGDFKATAQQKQQLWLKHFYPLDSVVPYHTFSAFLYVRPANKAFICVFFLFSSSPCSARFPLSFFVSCSHTYFWPLKERKGSLSRSVSFLLQAAEREAEDIIGHVGPCGGALMTGWDAIPCYGAGDQHFWLHGLHTHALIKLCRWKAHTGMCTLLVRRVSCYTQKAEAHTQDSGILMHPSSPSTPAKHGLKPLSRTKINASK